MSTSSISSSSSSGSSSSPEQLPAISGSLSAPPRMRGDFLHRQLDILRQGGSPTFDAQFCPRDTIEFLRNRFQMKMREEDASQPEGGRLVQALEEEAKVTESPRNRPLGASNLLPVAPSVQTQVNSMGLSPRLQSSSARGSSSQGIIARMTRLSLSTSGTSPADRIADTATKYLGKKRRADGELDPAPKRHRSGPPTSSRRLFG